MFLSGKCRRGFKTISAVGLLGVFSPSLATDACK